MSPSSKTAITAIPAKCLWLAKPNRMHNAWLISLKNAFIAVLNKLSLELDWVTLANVTQSSSRLNLFNTAIKAFLSDINQALCMRLGFANHKHFAGIAVIAVFDDGDIDIYDVVAFKNSIFSWNTMTNYLIDGSANRFWKTFVV